MALAVLIFSEGFAPNVPAPRPRNATPRARRLTRSNLRAVQPCVVADWAHSLSPVLRCLVLMLMPVLSLEKHGSTVKYFFSTFEWNSKNLLKCCRVVEDFIEETILLQLIRMAKKCMDIIWCCENEMKSHHQILMPRKVSTLESRINKQVAF